jgi:uncharacterized protein
LSYFISGEIMNFQHASVRSFKIISVTLISLFTVLFGCAQDNAQESNAQERTSVVTSSTQNNIVDITAAEQLVNNVGSLADQRQWQELSQLFSTKVVLDYGYPELLSPQEVIDRWQPLLSQFDRTQHQLSDIRVREQDGRVLAEANFTATHTLEGVQGGNEWILSGRYEYELENQDGTLKVMRMRMIPGEASGNTAVFEAAQQRANITPPERNHTVEQVTFQSSGETLKGWLYLPSSPRSNEVVIAAGSWTTVKEQMPRLYAAQLAESGLPTLIFDFRGYGESEGQPRHYESPQRKTEDFKSAISYVTSRPEFSEAQITLLGVCASAGYAAQATAEDTRVDRLAMVAPWLHDAEIARSIYTERPEIQPNGYDGLLAEGETARQRYEQNGEVQIVASASTSDPEAAMYIPTPGNQDYYFNPDRGLIPQWGNQFAVLSWPDWLTYNSHTSAAQIRVPTVIVHSENGAVPQGAKTFISAMTNSPEVHWIEGTQFDFYDGDAKIREALGLVTAFINSNS